MTEINMFKVRDDNELEGNWWFHITAKDFGFQDRIQDQSQHDISVGDALIHKVMVLDEDSGRKFPQITYFLVDKGYNVVKVPKDHVNAQLSNMLLKFLKKNGKYPFACHFGKRFKNGRVQVEYTPSTYDRFPLKLDPSSLDPELNQKLESLPRVPANPAPVTARPAGAGAIGKGHVDPVLDKIATQGSGGINIFGAKVLSIQEKKSTFGDYESTYYLIDVEGGEAAADAKKSTPHEKFGKVKVRISTNLHANSQLAAGDSITFRGSYKNDRFWGSMLQNIRKIVKE